LAPWAGLEPAT